MMNDFRMYIRTARPLVQFLVLIAVTFFAAGLLGALGLLACETFYGANWETIQTYLDDPTEPGAANVLKVLQLFNTAGIFLIPAMIFSQILSPQPETFLRLNRRFSLIIAAAIAFLFIAFIPITDFLSWLNNSIQLPSFLSGFEAEMRQSSESMNALMGTFLSMETFGQFLFNIFLMAVLPALGEEFFFRGVIQRMLLSRTQSVHLAVWVTAVAFALMHQQFFGIIPLAILGALLGYLKEWTGSLWASILAHFVNNASIIVVMYFSNYNMSEIESLSSPEWFYLVPALLVCATLIFFLYKNRIDFLADDDDLGDELRIEE